MTPPAITIPVDLAPNLVPLWQTIIGITRIPRVEWVVIGGQMVLAHALLHDTIPPAITEDADAVVDVRTPRRPMPVIVTHLTEQGFTLAGTSPDGIGHRYTRPADPLPLIFDVLAPEGLGARTDKTTTPPARTIEVPGGTQALRRRIKVTVTAGGETSEVPLPNLLAAIVLKGAAVGSPQIPPSMKGKHLRDLAFLCSLVQDPFTMRLEMDRKDLSRLRAAHPLHDASHAAWRLLPPAAARQGHQAFRILTADGTG